MNRKFGTVPSLRAREFWRGLSLPIDWVEGEIDELLKANLEGIFVNPDESESLLPLFKEVPKPVEECAFIDFVQIQNRKAIPRSFLRTFGSEFLARGTKAMNIKRRAYITGTGPWARLFSVLAVEKGYSSLAVIVEDPEEATDMIHRLRRFCFGVTIVPLRHSDLTLQPNNGSLLVNTLSPEAVPDLIFDLAYLNYLSTDGLVIETHQWSGPHGLLEESLGSGRPVLDGSATQGFAEYKAFSLYPGLLPWSLEEYLQKRQKFFQTTS